VSATIIAPETDRSVHLDPYYYKQILINLISNAVKYTDVGTITITLSFSPGLKIVVEDTGRGLSDMEKSKLFERFSNIGGQYKPSHLGLFVCKKTVEALSGTIEVVSREGVGTQFTVRLPCDQCPAVKLVEKAISVTKQQNFEGIRVLIVEDNKVNQRILKRMLVDEKCICDIASHGKEALELVVNHDFDVILMDIEMPIVGGLEATRILRRDLYTMPIIGLSGFAQSKDKDCALQSGMNDYLTKPFTKDQLCNLIAKYVVK